ncbi:MAG: Asp-tRNA(Asn)/Glu-tRNA(Gln) amidotransferase subunit GatC [Pelagibacterales bacterium]|jgi:aspartyl-tRNA(Asn)/glutamyl-tRNA(Gln) amidotransferase subunit C|nr:Asp-tRNA(Asn)/Glu-tRNA(Gln) amidotransferase subunit GatC [Pelagibacterales bacterium]|tara:strand:- start:369 stop:656 length:288 start_codon:yes stop_codon:yes gene_type:complete
MSIDKNTVKHISKLARISLDDEKIDSLSKDLSSIIKFIEKLNELKTDETKPLTSIINSSLKLRKDEIKDGKIRDQILKNSPEKNDEFFVVPKVIE